MTLQIKPVSVKNVNMEQAIKEVQSEKMTKLTLNISRSLRSEFKIAAERKDTNMTDVVMQYIKKYIQQ